ncbi:MAG TPA: agmatine deiminase [Gammaproteobacteria bacterium]|nr:agmatine deiminase [Gammaproteobacteria bacterium]
MNHFPAEWSPQAGVLLTWPHAASDWASHLTEIESIYEILAKSISEREQLIVLAYDLDHMQYISKKLAHCATEHLTLLPCATNDTWIRDYGPICLKSENAWLALNPCFNAWGEKYAYHLDQAVNRTLAWEFNLKLRSIDLILEGGNLETNGLGDLFMCRGALRLPHETQESLESHATIREIQSELGIDTCWILQSESLLGDDTDGHIDNLVRMTPESNQLLYSACDDQKNPNFARLKDLQRELANIHADTGKFRDRIPLPIPRQLLTVDNTPLPANYCNYLVMNGAVLVPTFADANDAVACERIAHCFPDREIISIDSRALIRQGGAVHCATMQLPDGIL